MTRLLVADDSETVRLLLRRRLEMCGYEVQTAADGREALEAIHRADPEDAPAVILLDAVMPGLSGVDALRALRASGDQTPVLIISAHLDAQRPEAMAALGADGCIAKPFEWDRLIERIAALT